MRAAISEVNNGSISQVSTHYLLEFLCQDVRTFAVNIVEDVLADGVLQILQFLSLWLVLLIAEFVFKVFYGITFHIHLLALRLGLGIFWDTVQQRTGQVMNGSRPPVLPR